MEDQVVPNSIRVPVQSGLVFPKGAMFMRIDANIDFDKKAKGGTDIQERDKDGVRLWTVTVTDLEQPEEGKFGGSTEVKVKIASEVQPVVPSPQVEGFPPKVEFVGVTLTPWKDDRRCMGRSTPHRCGAKLAWSISAKGMVPFGTVVDDEIS
jgi:hypothetical protein